MDDTICNKLPRSSTNENFTSKNVESSDSDLELNATINKLNTTHLSSTENIFSEHEIENDEFDELKRPEVYKKAFKIKKPDHELKLKDFTDGNGLRYYSDKIKNT